MTRQRRIEELLASFADLDDGLRRRKVRGHIYLTGKIEHPASGGDGSRRVARASAAKFAVGTTGR